MKRIILLITMMLGIAAATYAQVPSAQSAIDRAAKPGDTLTVTVNVKKCDLACFAQYQQLLPEGMTAIEINGGSDNANFYFDNSKVQYQWYKLPIERDIITLKYRLVVASTMKPGKYNLPGYFSYQMHNRLGQVNTPLIVEVQ